jgi:hypothetical protein
MTDHDIKSEIAALRSQLDSLSRSGEEGRQGAVTAPAPRREDETGTVGEWLHELLTQAEGLWKGLDIQLKDAPAKTVLVIFALGVLTGRLLSKRE